MLENLLFSLNATIPLFLLMAVGYFIRRIRVVDAAFIKTANNFNFKVTLPVLLFVDMAGTDFKETWNLRYFLFCFIVTSVVFFGLWGISRLVIKDKDTVGEFVQACYRCSLAVNGMALVQSVYGSTEQAGVMILAAVPLYNIFAVILLQTTSPRNSKTLEAGQMKKAFAGIAKNPIIIAIILGFLSSLIGIKWPAIVSTALSYVGRIGTPFALICIGADFDFRKAFNTLGKSLVASIVKLVILPLIFVPAAIWMGFEGGRLISILIMLAGPTTPVSYIMAKQYGHDGTITSSAVGLTTLFSSLTLTVFIFLIKTLGYL